jgi:CRP/FNR family transcriptional regulator
MSVNTPERATQRAGLGPVACRSCDLFEICCVIDALAGASALQRSPVLRHVGPGETIYRAGDPAENIYAIRKGFAKSERTAGEGRTRVIALHVPGEVLGADSIRAGRYTNDVVAVSPATLCELAVKPLLGATQGASALRDGLEVLMTSARDRSEHPSGSVEERLEGLELTLMKRIQAHGLRTDGLCLKLPKQAVADLLGVHVDSLRRSLKRTHTTWTRKANKAFSLMSRAVHG